MTDNQAPHPFIALADHMGRAYLRYSFTKGTKQEVDFMFDAGIVHRGDRVLDVGCGPGRHAIELARRGCIVHGIDISSKFIDVAREDAHDLNATFSVSDARNLDYESEFDAVICVCQGAFGMNVIEQFDKEVLLGIFRALKPGGRLFLTAFNAYFSVRHHVESSFDADTGISRENTVVRSEDGVDLAVELITGCYTPRELRLLAQATGLEVMDIFGGEPGQYLQAPPSVDLPENLLVARKPA